MHFFKKYMLPFVYGTTSCVFQWYVKHAYLFHIYLWFYYNDHLNDDSSLNCQIHDEQTFLLRFAFAALLFFCWFGGVVCSFLTKRY